MDSAKSFIETLCKIVAKDEAEGYLGQLVNFSSSRDNLRLLPKYFSQINPNLVKSTSRVLFVYLRGLRGNVLSDDELLSAIALVESLRGDYIDLYKELCSEIESVNLAINVIYEDFEDVDGKIRHFLRCINSRSPKALTSLYKEGYLPIDFLKFMLSLVVLVKDDFTGEIMKIVRTSEFYDVVVYMYTHSHTDADGKYQRDEDWFYKMAVEFIVSCLSTENFPSRVYLDYSVYDLDKVDIMSKSVASLRKELKEANKTSYIESESRLEIEDTVLECAVTSVVTSPVEDKCTSKSQRLEFLSNLSVLVLKDDALSICSLPRNFRVESSSRVDTSVISSLNFDVVLVLTKALKHCDFYRIKANVRSKLVLSASTNRGRVLDDVFYSV